MWLNLGQYSCNSPAYGSVEGFLIGPMILAIARMVGKIFWQVSENMIVLK